MTVGSPSTDHTENVASDKLDFVFDAAISAQVRGEIVDGLSRGRKDLRKLVRRELDSRDIVAEFQPTLGSLGLRQDNLADAMTAFWIVMWQVIHGEALPSAASAAAVKAQVTDTLKNNPAARDPRKRQMMGEGMLYEARLAEASYQEAKEAGNEFQLRQMAASARQNMRKKGVNLGKLNISEAGLQPL